MGAYNCMTTIDNAIKMIPSEQFIEIADPNDKHTLIFRNMPGMLYRGKIREIREYPTQYEQKLRKSYDVTWMGAKIDKKYGATIIMMVRPKENTSCG